MIFENLIKNGESETVEFKQGFSREAIETAVAFTNTKGVTILVGVKDNGQIVGLTIGKETLVDWRNQISQSTEPAIYSEIDEIEIRGKTIIQIVIKEYPLKPISFRGRCFRRVRNSNYQMTPSEIAEMHLQSTGNSWDALPARDTTPADLDPDKINEFIKQSLATGRRKFQVADDRTEILTKLELIKKNQPTWASVLLFGKKPLIFASVT